MTPRERYLHGRAWRSGYHLRRRGTGYSLLDTFNKEELECPDLDALELCVKHELEARQQHRLAAACEGRLIWGAIGRLTSSQETRDRRDGVCLNAP